MKIKSLEITQMTSVQKYTKDNEAGKNLLFLFLWSIC